MPQASKSGNTLIDGTDMPSASWVDRWLPSAVGPYARLMRLDRPIGTWLLLFPCWWSLALGYETLPAGSDGWLQLLQFYVLFGVGAVVMRGAGCTWNDITDKDFDGRVERTRTRPIPSGQVSVKQAFLFIGVLLTIGFLILITFNWMAIALGVTSLLLVLIYPLMKRVTYWPQIFLGLAFNWGALMGWTVVTGRLDWPPLVLYVAGIFWTLGYDTIYAHQDKEDDALIGVKSTALKLGANTRPWLVAFYALTVGLMALAAWLDGLTWVFFAGLGLGAAHLAWQLIDVDFDDPPDCLRKFRANRFFGWIILAALFAELAAKSY